MRRSLEWMPPLRAPTPLAIRIRRHMHVIMPLFFTRFRGEISTAQSYAERCITLSEAHGFRQWRGLAHAVRGICVTLLESSSTALEENPPRLG